MGVVTLSLLVIVGFQAASFALITKVPLVWAVVIGVAVPVVVWLITGGEL